MKHYTYVDAEKVETRIEELEELVSDPRLNDTFIHYALEHVEETLQILRELLDCINSHMELQEELGVE